MVDVVALVFARGGSKGIPSKNLRLVGGVPLVGRAVTAARACPSVGRVVVSTDDPAIADAARQYGADVPWMRPAELATDDAPEWLAWRHAVDALASEGHEPDVIVSVPPTAPLRDPVDVQACIEHLLGSDADLVLTVTPARRNPYFNMVVLDPEGRVALVGGDPRFSNRQQAPAVYDVTTVAYATRPAHVRRATGVLDGVVRAVVVPTERALDVDDELDLRVADLLARHGTTA